MELFNPKLKKFLYISKELKGPQLITNQSAPPKLLESSRNFGIKGSDFYEVFLRASKY